MLNQTHTHTSKRELLAQRDELLAARTTKQLKDMWRLSRTDPRDESFQVRAWVTQELIRRIGREKTAAFERSEVLGTPS